MSKPAISLAFLLCTACFAATGPSTGLISGLGEDSQGSPIYAVTSSSNLTLGSGVAVHLSSALDSTVFRDHFVPRQDAVRVENFQQDRIEAGNLQIQPAEPDSRAVIRLTPKTVEVAAQRGGLDMSNGSALLTRVRAGAHASFRQRGSPAHNSLFSNTRVMTWVIGITAAAALAIGLTAAAQGKSPF